MDWDDLVLSSETSLQVEKMVASLTQHFMIVEEHDLDRKLRTGFRVLFYGPAGTGKTLTAELLGNRLKKDIYRIDLALMVSKYIGETEKNLSKVFTKAENHNWILFFDEADALLGKRTGIRDAYDKYANQETAYLLQRIEEYNGITILATNFRENIDDAFIRRCNTIIHFPKPESKERYSLWQKAFRGDIILMKDVNLRQLSESYELTGAEIKDIVHAISLKKRAKNKYSVYHREIISEIQKQIKKRKKKRRKLFMSNK